MTTAQRETMSVTEGSIDQKIKSVSYMQMPNTTMIICTITMENGFVLIGYEACVDPANFNEAYGRECAYKAAYAQIWPLEGYLLKQRMFEQGVK